MSKTLNKIYSKIINKDNYRNFINNFKKENKKVVFTNGCFDIIHKGHVEYLAKAADFGDVFIIGLNTDKSVSRLKGKNRPIQDEMSRALGLAAFSFVGYVILFDEDTPLKLITEIVPDVLIKGADYKAEDIVGYDVIVKSGGEVKTIEFTEGYSTSKIVEKIILSK